MSKPSKSSSKPAPPAAGHFGLDHADVLEMRAYRPAGCPSPEQFEARFCLTGEHISTPRAA